MEPALLRRLGLERGDQLRIGDALFTVAGEVRSEPDRMEASLTGPRVFLSMDGLSAVGCPAPPADDLQGAVSNARRRIGHRACSMAAAAAGCLLDRVQTWTSGNPGVERAIGQSETFWGWWPCCHARGWWGCAGDSGLARAPARCRCDSAVSGDDAGRGGPRLSGADRCAGTRRQSVGAVVGTVCLVLVPSLLGDILPPGAIDPVQPVAVLQGTALGTESLCCLPGRPYRGPSAFPRFACCGALQSR